MKVLVTGGSGFVGRHLIALLGARGHEVAATRASPGSAAAGWHELRLPDRAGCVALLEAERPQAVIHLAALSDVPGAERDPAAAVAIHLEGTLGLCQALDQVDPRGAVRLVHVSTAHVYAVKAGSAEQVLDENAPLGPTTVYGRTKLAAELAACCQALAARRPMVVFRPFQHVGAGQRPAFALASFAQQIAQAELGRREPVIEVGNLDVARDYCDVADVVLAYALAAEGAVPPDIYNLASGRSTPLGALLDMLLRLSCVRVRVRVAAERLRPGEPASVRGVAQKIQAACGWQPKVPLSDSVSRLLDSFREKEKDH